MLSGSVVARSRRGVKWLIFWGKGIIIILSSASYSGFSIILCFFWVLYNMWSAKMQKIVIKITSCALPETPICPIVAQVDPIWSFKTWIFHLQNPPFLFIFISQGCLANINLLQCLVLKFLMREARIIGKMFFGGFFLLWNMHVSVAKIFFF